MSVENFVEYYYIVYIVCITKSSFCLTFEEKCNIISYEDDIKN